MRLDHLEALVHQRRRVDRDARAHAPGRMPQRLLGRHVREVGERSAAERPAAGRHDQRLDRVDVLGRQQLLQRRVLGVDRQQARAAARERRAHERPARDEALLVGERDVDAGVERRQRGLEPGRPDDRVEHDVGAALGGELRRHGAGRAPGSARAPRRRLRDRRARSSRTPSRSACSSTPRRRGPPRARTRAGRDRRRRPRSPAVRPTRCCREVATVRITRRVGQSRLDLVTPCRAARRSRAPRGRRRAARRCGRARRRGPASSVPESLTPRSRLRNDSKRSPSGAASATPAPTSSACWLREALAVERDPGREDARGQADHEALDGLLGRDRGRQAVAPQEAPAEVGEDVGGPRAEQHREHEVPAEAVDRPVAGRAAPRGSPCRRRCRAPRTSSRRPSRAPTRARPGPRPRGT